MDHYTDRPQCIRISQHHSRMVCNGRAIVETSDSCIHLWPREGMTATSCVKGLNLPNANMNTMAPSAKCRVAPQSRQSLLSASGDKFWALWHAHAQSSSPSAAQRLCFRASPHSLRSSLFPVSSFYPFCLRLAFCLSGRRAWPISQKSSNDDLLHNHPKLVQFV